MSTGSEVFCLLKICLDSSKFVLLSFFSLIKPIRPRVSTKPLPNDAKSPLPVDVRRSKTLLLTLPFRRRYLPKINYPNLSLLTAKFCISQNFEIKKKGKPFIFFYHPLRFSLQTSWGNWLDFILCYEYHLPTEISISFPESVISSEKNFTFSSEIRLKFYIMSCSK